MSGAAGPWIAMGLEPGEIVGLLWGALAVLLLLRKKLRDARNRERVPPDPPSPYDPIEPR